MGGSDIAVESGFRNSAWYADNACAHWLLQQTQKTAQVYGSLTHVPCVVRNKWEFPKIRVSYFGVLIIRILLFRVIY